MNLLEAFKSAVSGQEDKAGIDMVDVYLTNTKNAVDHSKEKKIAEFNEVMSAEIESEEYKWFLLSEVITKWNLVDDFIADDIRQALTDNSKNIEYHIRYQMLRVMGYARGGLIPNDILNDKYLKNSAPNFWLELLLLAYQNGNPDTITGHIVSLVEGQEPLLTCNALHDLLPEVRQAYGSISEFRKQIKIIARSMDSAAGRSILNAAEKIVGGGLNSISKPSTVKTGHTEDVIPNNPIPERWITNDGVYNNCQIPPEPQMTTV